MLEVLEVNKDGKPLRTKEINETTIVYKDYYGKGDVFDDTVWNGQASSITIATTDFSRGPQGKGKLVCTKYNYQGGTIEEQVEENNVRTIKAWNENDNKLSFNNDRFSIHYFKNGTIKSVTFIESGETFDIETNSSYYMVNGELEFERTLTTADIDKVNSLYSL